MNILFVSKVPLPVLKYGGTERVMYWHMRQLKCMGHRVYLLCPPKTAKDEHHGRDGILRISFDFQKHEDWRPLIPDKIDLIHLFNPTHLDLKDYPVLITVEGNGKKGETFHLNTVFVSKRHAQNHGSDQFIYNGIDLKEYPAPSASHLPIQFKRSWDNLLFLAKASWKVKNLKQCAQLARNLKKKLHVAGGRWRGLSPWVKSYGMIDQRTKLEMLPQMDALLFLVRWPEPFGLAVIEAMACGVPVLASKHGSLPELVTPESGKLFEGMHEVKDYLSSSANEFDPMNIRQYVQDNFAIEKISEKYMKKYALIRKGDTLNKHPPCSLLTDSAEELLPF